MFIASTGGQQERPSKHIIGTTCYLPIHTGRMAVMLSIILIEHNCNLTCIGLGIWGILGCIGTYLGIHTRIHTYNKEVHQMHLAGYLIALCFVVHDDLNQNLHTCQ